MSKKRGKTWVAHYKDEHGERVRVATVAKTKAQADILEHELAVRAERIRLGLEVNERNPKGFTINTAVDWWAENIAVHQARGGGVATLRKHVTAEFGELRLERATRGAIESWLAERAQTGITAATVNHVRAHLSSVFTHMIKRELFHGLHPVRPTTRRQIELAAPRVLPAEAMLPLIEQAPTPQWRLIFLLALYGGMRRSEIEALTWARVDLKNGVISVVKTKAKKPRRVPIHAEVLPALLRAKDQAAGDRVISRAAWGKSAEIVRRALERAGVEVPDGTDACFHSLRHTWATQATVCGARDDYIRLIGWGPATNSILATTYLHIPVPALAAELGKLFWPSPLTSQEAQK